MAENKKPTTDPHSPCFRWGKEDALPTRILRPLHPLPKLPAVLAGPTWIRSGPLDQPFDFTAHLRRLMVDIVARSADLGHIDVSRLLISALQARSARVHGLQARVTPLRFPNGMLTRVRRGVVFQVQRYFHGTHEFLYLMTFCLPRFLDQDFDGKLITIFHELFHIGPRFDGDLRRHEGRYQIHTHSQREYDRAMAHHARAYLATQPDPTLHEFLRLNFAQLTQRHGGVAGIVVPRPKVIPLRHAAKEG